MLQSGKEPPTSAGTGTEDTRPGEQSVTTRSPFRAGLELGDGRYRLIAPLGRGGMGEVWEAEHTLLHRTVAIKLVLPHAADRELPARLQREAELAARLDHPNVVGVTDFGLIDPRQPFVVMERLSGRPLSAMLRERGRLPWTQARDIAVQIAAGLACAHRSDIVHRDLKPSNVFVLDDPHGHLRIKIIDFGLAKATQLGPGERALTKSGAVFGTPGYMSPEQIRGEPLDGRADLYSLGVILFEMIVGEPPWKRGPMVQLLYSHLFEQAPTMRSRALEVPPDLDALVARCLCKDRTMRPADADAMRLELVGAGSGKGATIVPDEALPLPPPDLQARYGVAVSRVVAAPAPAKRRWAIAVAFGVLAAIAGIVTMQVIPRLRRADLPAEATAPTIEEAPIEAAPIEAVPIEDAVLVEPSVDPPPTREAPAPVDPPARVEPPPQSPVEPTRGAEPARHEEIDKRPAKSPPRAPKTAPTRSEPAKVEPAKAEPTTTEPEVPPPHVPTHKGDTLQWIK